MLGLDAPSLKTVARAGAALMLAAALSGGLVACGKRGDPEPPPGKEDKFPRSYPDPRTYPDHRPPPAPKTN